MSLHGLHYCSLRMDCSRTVCTTHSCMTFLSLSRFVYFVSFFFTSSTFVVFLNWLKNTCLSSAIMATALRPSLNSIHCTRAIRSYLQAIHKIHTHIYFFVFICSKINCCRLACCIVPRITTRAKYVQKKNRWKIVRLFLLVQPPQRMFRSFAAFAFTIIFFCSTFCWLTDWPSGKRVCFS